jgi:hypothetical protein
MLDREPTPFDRNGPDARGPTPPRVSPGRGPAKRGLGTVHRHDEVGRVGAVRDGRRVRGPFYRGRHGGTRPDGRRASGPVPGRDLPRPAVDLASGWRRGDGAPRRVGGRRGRLSDRVRGTPLGSSVRPGLPAGVGPDGPAPDRRRLTRSRSAGLTRRASRPRLRRHRGVCRGSNWTLIRPLAND